MLADIYFYPSVPISIIILTFNKIIISNECAHSFSAGTTVKVHVVNLDEEVSVHPTTIRCHPSNTVEELYGQIAQVSTLFKTTPSLFRYKRLLYQPRIKRKQNTENNSSVLSKASSLTLNLLFYASLVYLCSFGMCVRIELYIITSPRETIK